MSRPKINEELKQFVIDRAENRCEYCLSLRKYSPQPFTIEHIIPLALQGETNSENLAFSCGGCNGHKYTKIDALDPITGQKTPLFNPRKDSWSTHFEWDSEYLQIIGLTPTGRATVRSLHLNREAVVSLRQITKLTKEHPPNR